MFKKLFWILFLFPIYSFANPMVIGYEGRYISSNKPLIIEKNSDGTWSKNPNIFGLPVDINHASLYASSCTTHYCVAAGNYQKNGNSKVLPLILSSRDQEKSWTAVNKISGLPSYLKEVDIYALNCENDTCMAGGRVLYDIAGYEHQLPVLLISSNNGETWTASNASVVNLMGKTDGQLVNVVKSGPNWLVSGFYYYPIYFPSPILHQAKLFMISHDNGSTWKEINIEGGPIIPPAAGLLFDLKCTNNVCLQTGSVSKGLPSIARSEDNGNTWKMLKDISITPTVLDCYQNFCVSAVDSTDHELAISISHDQGITWTKSQTNNIPDDFQYGGIKQISCLNDKMCAAIGWWRNKKYDFQFFPMLLTSHDAGATWTYQDSQYVTGRTNFISVHCAADVCLIIGDTEDSPLILTSHDEGQSWTSQTEITGMPLHSSGSLISFLNSPSGLSKELNKKIFKPFR
jgi:hypothetical protein